jgi:hypothetical protein
MSPLTWFETRGMADAVIEVTFDADARGNFARNFNPHWQWFAVPLMTVPPGPHPWDCRMIFDDLEPRPATTYTLDAFFLSPQLAVAALPVGALFTVHPGHVVGHGRLVEWLSA